MAWPRGAFEVYRNRSPWNTRPCDPGRRRSRGSRCCCFSWVSLGAACWAACCRCHHCLLLRSSYRPVSHASCSSIGYCFWPGCCSTAAASCRKMTGWPWRACPEWPPVCWEMQVADCKYVNKKYTTTQPLHSSQHAGRGEERLREEIIEKVCKVNANVTIICLQNIKKCAESGKAKWNGQI